MAATDGSADGRADGVEDDGDVTISAYSTSEERTVFTESDNGDGWIATDLTVEVRQ